MIQQYLYHGGSHLRTQTHDMDNKSHQQALIGV